MAEDPSHNSLQLVCLNKQSNSIKMNKCVIKVCLVQPVQSPYWTERLRILAQNKNFELALLLERDSFAHRPGWQPESIKNVSIHVLGSMVINEVKKSDDLGYRFHGIRSIPWLLTTELFRRRPDVVVLCNATQLIFALPAKWLLGIRVALIVEDTPHATRHLSLFARKVKQLLYKHADCCYAFSDDARQFLEQMGIISNVIRSSWSVDMNRFKRFKTDGCLATGTDIMSTRTVIFVGALVPGKGILQLLAAWRELSTKVRQSAQLLIVGSGPLQYDSQQFIDNNALTEVKLLGQKSYSEVIELLKKSDLFVLPTLQDLFSLTVLEAMACGCPVITTPFNGARELVEDGRNGWIVDPTQPGTLASVLMHALSGEVDLEGMGIVARSRVEQMDNSIVMAQFGESLCN